MKKEIYFLLVFILGIAFSCSEDDFSESEHSSHHLEQNMRKNKVTFAEMKQFLKEHSNKNSLPKSLSVSGKNGNSYITSIDSTSVTFITVDNVASFTLRINTLDDENYGFSNLVVKSYNGQTEEYIYHYNPDAEWLTAFNSGEKRDYEGEIFVTDIDGNNLSSFTNYSKGTIGALCFATIEIPCYGSECPCTDGNGQTIVKIFACNGENNSGGNGNGNGPTPPGGFPPTDPTPPGGGTNYSDFDYFLMDLSPAQKAWFVAPANSSIFSNVYNYLYDQDYSWEAVELMTWAIDFFMQNPNTTWAQFKNWFMGTPEMENIEEIDPNLIQYETPIVQQSLPSLTNWNTYFPKIVNQNGSWSAMESPQVYQLAGGTIYNSHLNDTSGAYQNACAIRGSRALLYSGINIPIIKIPGNPPRQLTQKGGDNKNYILAATSFEKFMIDTFGDTPNKLTGADANDPQKVKNLLQGKNGIYVIINADPRPSSQGGAGYSGHVDNIVNGICISGAYTKPKGGVKSIRIWVLN